jgi:folate-dependent phosphoribosylglycinamide formyltransferase PurN
VLKKAERWNEEQGWDVATAAVSTYDSSRKVSEVIVGLADRYNIDLVVSLGFRSILAGTLLEEYGYAPDEDDSVYEARAINLHPGTVPLTSGLIGKEASEAELTAYHQGELAVAQCVMHAITPNVDDPEAVFDRRYVSILRGDSVDDLHARKRRMEQAAVPYMINNFLAEQRAYREHV